MTDDPTRGRLRTGARGQEVWRTQDGAGGTVAAHVLDPVADLDVLHAWVTRPEGRFWGLGDLTPAELRETYEFVDTLPTHHAYLVRWDGEPVALVQLYHPEDDPLAAAYDAAPGDVGVHFFKGSPTAPWSVLGPAMLELAFAEPGAERLVAEPDARNRAILARMRALGFAEAGTVRVDLPHGPKTARLAFCTRERARAVVERARGPQAPAAR